MSFNIHKNYGGVAVIKTKITSLVVIGLILGAGLGLYGNIDDDVMAAKTDSQTTKTVKQAKSLSQQYQYKEAKSVLSGHKGTTVDHLKKSINKQQSKLVTWNDPTKISHLFYHSLIVDPGKAFSSKQAQGYKDYMVTIDEFMPMLNQLYDNGYVLINFKDIISIDKQGKVTFKPVKLPEGKKPLIISQDDVNYYEYMKNSGFADKLVVNKQGDVKNQYTNNGQKKIGDYDMVPIIDTFIKKHPDFSYGGSKGVIAETGYNGALGYRSSKSQYGDTKKTHREAKKATKVANAMKKEGWQFASHSWGHINMTTASVDDIKKDTALWQKEVQPIVGKTPVLIFPFGADIGSFTNYTNDNAKYTYLKSSGFSIFDNVDASQTSWGQLTNDYYRNARINVDGIRLHETMTGENTVLNDFFNTKDFYHRDK